MIGLLYCQHQQGVRRFQHTTISTSMYTLCSELNFKAVCVVYYKNRYNVSIRKCIDTRSDAKWQIPMNINLLIERKHKEKLCSMHKSTYNQKYKEM